MGWVQSVEKRLVNAAPIFVIVLDLDDDWRYGVARNGDRDALGAVYCIYRLDQINRWTRLLRGHSRANPRPKSTGLQRGV